MSDSDAGDDSGIDKEALREELREKYERDEREREATQRMSDLLLKGATMTNAHCGTCGDPLFQQQGTTFCPSCHGRPEAVDGTGLETETDQPDATTGSTPSDNVPATDPKNRAPETTATEPEDRTTDTSPDPTSPANVPSKSDREPPTPPSPAGRTPSTPDSASSSDRTPRSVDGDLETARDSLRRALEKFAAGAAETDDPRYATECLEAAHEASKVLERVR